MSVNFDALKLPKLTVDQKTLFSETCKDDPCLISLLLNEFEPREKDSPFFSGLKPHKFDKCDWPLLYKKVGSHLLKKYEGTGRKWKHAEQRKVLEKAIRLFDKASGGAEVALEKGKAYLYRSRIIRPKGFTIPGSKQETLEKALDACKKAKQGKQPQADHFAGLVALEMDRCSMELEPDDFAQLLNDAVNSIDDPFKSFPSQKIIEFYQMRLRLEQVRQGLYDAPVLGKVFDFDKPGLELEKLKVAVCNPNVSADLRFSCHIRLLDRLRCHPFSHPLWGDTVHWVVRLHPENKFWQEFSLDIWEAAEEISRRTSSLHLRWYWSRQRDLYDLAFLAALEEDEFEMAAQIADSAKNRPALTWQALEKMDYDDEKLEGIRKREIEQNAQELGGGYQKDLTIHTPDAEMLSLYPELSETKAIVVQFYLVHLKDFERGYALIYDGQTGKWSVEDFDFKPIWDRYLQWQSAYLELPPGQREKSATHLKALCLALGKELDFLFELGEERDMVFVPHDFLHRVPVHGAIIVDEDEDEYILLEKFNCTYLPSLRDAVPHSESPSENQPVLLQYFNPFSKDDREKTKLFDKLKDLFDEERSKKEASADDLAEIAQHPPPMLALHCHGEADAVNPFFSKLKLKKDMKLSELLVQKAHFTGTHVFLGACETDLIPPLDSPLDEQLSMAAMFLQKRAASVMGTLWKADAEIVGEMLSHKENSFDLSDDFYEKLIDDPLGSSNELYRCLCFKLYRYSG